MIREHSKSKSTGTASKSIAKPSSKKNPYEPDKGVRKSAASKNVHVVPRDGSWAVQTPGAVKAYRVTSSQQEAVKIAKDIAKKRGSEVITHGRDGKIRSKDSYGRDPNPPKDKEH